MTRPAASVIGCLSFLYAIGAVCLAAAWFGLPFGNNHGLDVVFNGDQIAVTGTVVRFDIGGTSRRRTSTPVIDIPVGKRLFRFYGEGTDSHPFSKGDSVPVSYPAGHPERAYICTFRQMYLGPLIWLAFAVPFLALALFGTYMQIHDRKRAGPPTGPASSFD